MQWILGSLITGTLLFQNPGLISGFTGGNGFSEQQFSNGGSILPNINRGGGRFPCN